ncbi:uncharacterized protein LOC125043072 [Penaeus chinensis]|uniref:uncharacterized protein LOC125043072 n=1 Tax=Penaeus chinensis TaxID=139456 RepID=UPI001FB69857|nr:uncharacterized protein LOC125043072 [Penaeus chinensis]
MNSINKSIWRCWYLCRGTKLHVFKTLMLPVLLYGSGTWTLFVVLESLDAFCNKSRGDVLGDTSSGDEDEPERQQHRKLFPPFDVRADNNVWSRWKKYLSRFDRLMTAMDVTNSDRKTAMLLHFAGPDVDDIHDTIAATVQDQDGADSTDIYVRTTTVLTTYFALKTNTAFEVYSFRQATQGRAENIDSFTTRLRHLAKSCDFNDTDTEIKNQIIFSCKSQALRRISESQATTLENNTQSQVNLVSHNNSQRRSSYRSKPRTRTSSQPRQRQSTPGSGLSGDRRPSRPKQKSGKCHYCGHDLPHRTCPARDAANVVSDDVHHHSDDDYDYGYSISTDETDNVMSTTNKTSCLPSCIVKISGLPVTMTIDSGASVNIVDRETYESMPVKPQLHPPLRKVFPYGSRTPIHVLGVANTTITHGFQVAQQLGVLSVAQLVKEKSPQTTNWPTEEFPQLFSGMGKLRNKAVKLHIDESVIPKQQRHRRIPFHLRKDVESTIAELEANDIIEKAEGPTPWEYHQYELDGRSRYITTFSTNKSIYRYKRLMFGINSASEIFQNAVDEMLTGLPGVKNISGDIIVFDCTQKEHDANLQATLLRLQQHGARLNQHKCKFSQPTVTYFGHIFGIDGVQDGSKKIQAVKEMAPPTDVSEVRSLLGMAQYVSGFIPNFAYVTTPLRRLTHQDVPWSWSRKET